MVPVKATEETERGVLLTSERFTAVAAFERLAAGKGLTVRSRAAKGAGRLLLELGRSGRSRRCREFERTTAMPDSQVERRLLLDRPGPSC
ncbi:hypothetical protein GCM10023147_48790 [Tsukamurella soli]|uniref:Uncharacterized protein n=1 Tax=Tsukamurella soli TaxID=644556 RepID=A0ABP8KEV4_9ACTN